MKVRTLLLSVWSLLLVAPTMAKEVYRFDFGSGRVKKGYNRVDDKTLYGKGQTFGFDLVEAPDCVSKGWNALKGDACAGNKGFYFSVDVPEGDYLVKVLLGNPTEASATMVRAESRRLFIEELALPKGKSKEVSFTTNVRYVEIDAHTNVRIKPREVNKRNWDKRLTLEFNGAAPAVQAVVIERVSVPTVFLCGNSTVVDQDNEPWCGWGQMIPRFFNEKVSFANYAESGESGNSFISARRLAKIASLIKPGDYIFVEFGHNDQKQTGPGKGPWLSYTESLKEYIQVARKAGATPVLVTSMHRRRFDENGQVVNTLGEFPEAVRVLAKKENVALIELNNMSEVLYEALGPDESVKAFVHYPPNTFPNQPNALADNTHFNSYGGYQLAKCILEGIRTALPDLAKYIRSDAPRYNPAQPDDPDSFYMPSSPFVEIEKPDGD